MNFLVELLGEEEFQEIKPLLAIGKGETWDGLDIACLILEKVDSSDETYDILQKIMAWIARDDFASKKVSDKIVSLNK